MRIGSFCIGLEHVSLEVRETRGLNEVDINNKSNKQCVTDRKNDVHMRSYEFIAIFVNLIYL